MHFSVRILNYEELFTHIKTFITIRVTVHYDNCKVTTYTETALLTSHTSQSAVTCLQEYLIKWRDNDILSNKAGEASKANKNAKRKSTYI